MMLWIPRSPRRRTGATSSSRCSCTSGTVYAIAPNMLSVYGVRDMEKSVRTSHDRCRTKRRGRCHPRDVCVPEVQRRPGTQHAPRRRSRRRHATRRNSRLPGRRRARVRLRPAATRCAAPPQKHCLQLVAWSQGSGRVVRVGCDCYACVWKARGVAMPREAAACVSLDALLAVVSGAPNAMLVGETVDKVRPVVVLHLTVRRCEHRRWAVQRKGTRQ